MKRHAILLMAALVVARPCFAQWAVIDAANLTQNIMNYAELVLQIAKQGEEINNQVQQIQQTADLLDRLGRMSDFTVVVGFSGLQLDITTQTQMQTWNANLSGVTGAGLFGDTRGGIYAPVNESFTEFDGTSVPRDPSLYKPAQGVTASVDNFKSVQADVYARRAQLRQAIAQTSAALQVATTDAQEKKLSAVLNAQYGELASLDSEVLLSAAEVQAKANEATSMNAAHGQADTESRTQLEQQESQTLTTTFQPSYDSVLQYLNEEPYQP